MLTIGKPWLVVHQWLTASGQDRTQRGERDDPDNYRWQSIVLPTPILAYGTACDGSPLQQRWLRPHRTI
jgi:hypothetical protein